MHARPAITRASTLAVLAWAAATAVCAVGVWAQRHLDIKGV